MGKMILKYGGTAVEGLVTIDPSIDYQFAADGVTKLSRTISYRINGLIRGTSNANIKSKVDTLIGVFDEDGHDLNLYYPDGVTKTELSLDSSDTLGGTVIVEPPHVTGSGGPATYAVVWPWTCTVQATYEEDGATDSTVVDFTETLTFTGDGGPRVVRKHPLKSPAVEYITLLYTDFQATQSGSATGWNSYIEPPEPLWPEAEITENRQISYTGPSLKVGEEDRNYVTNWNYQFVSTVPLSGNPTEREGL